MYEDACLPYQIESSPGLGRDILPTELIMSEAAAILSPCQNTQPRLSVLRGWLPWSPNMMRQTSVTSPTLPTISDFIEYALGLLLNNQRNPGLWQHILFYTSKN